MSNRFVVAPFIIVCIVLIGLGINIILEYDKNVRKLMNLETIEYPAIVISIESYDEELNTYTIRGLNKVETEFRDQCGRHLLNDTVRVETVTR